MGIRPNAVSALLRRARVGFRYQWLREQVPVALKNNQEHIAELLPDYFLAQKGAPSSRQVRRHIEDCSECREVYYLIEGSAVKVSSTSLLTLGFGALVITLPAASPLSLGAVSGAAALITAGGVATVDSGFAAGTAVSATGVAAAGVGAIAITLLSLGLISSNGSNNQDDLGPSCGETVTGLADHRDAHKQSGTREGASEGFVPNASGGHMPEPTPELGRVSYIRSQTRIAANTTPARYVTASLS